VPPGPAVWDELRGGECLEPFTSAWERTFTVVDCAVPHPAQMTYRGTFADAAVWPGEAALSAQLNLACTSDSAINLAVAGQWADVQVQGTYPVTADQWDSGDHYYYCFVSRSSGEPLTGDLSIPVAPAA
jgi:hypothetical protein